MKIPVGATSFIPKLSPLLPGSFQGSAIRHTFRPKGTQDWLVIYTRGGSGLYRFEGGEFRSRPHDITLYRPGTFQDYQFAPETGKWDLLWAHFIARSDWMPWLDWPEIAPGFMRLHVSEKSLRRRIILRWQEMIRWDFSSYSCNRPLAVNALEEVLIWCDSINPRRVRRPVDPRVDKAREHLTTRLAEPFSETTLARAAGLSPSRLRHLFRSQTGDSPRHFLEQQRLRKAGDLLALSRRTIAEIALETGFANPFYFSLRFKKETGESPRAYRHRVTLGKE